MQRTALLFAGQGAQVVGMGQDLFQQLPEAQRWFELANNTLGYDLAKICFEGPEAELTKTEHAQPGIFLVGWVAFQLLRERIPGFPFQATAGLSLGEFTALTAAEVMSFDDGLKVVRARGRLMQEACEVTQGGMAALLGLDEETARAVCNEAGAQVANLNCPGQIVISGAVEAVNKACELAKARGAKRALPLPVAGAYHSPLMSSAQPKLHTVLTQVRLQPATVPVISNVTARPHGDSASVINRLVEQVTASVRWEDSMRYLLQQGFTRFIELGPGTALTGFMKRIDKGVQILHVADLSSLEETVKGLAAPIATT